MKEYSKKEVANFVKEFAENMQYSAQSFLKEKGLIEEEKFSASNVGFLDFIMPPPMKEYKEESPVVKYTGLDVSKFISFLREQGYINYCGNLNVYALMSDWSKKKEEKTPFEIYMEEVHEIIDKEIDKVLNGLKTKEELMDSLERKDEEFEDLINEINETTNKPPK